MDATALTEIDHLGDEMADCTDNCLEAAQACEWCADECADGDEEMARCLRLCRDVADLTTLHARFMTRNSNYSAELAEVCAGTCEECDRHDAEHCQVCADVLRECAETCRNTASA